MLKTLLLIIALLPNQNITTTESIQRSVGIAQNSHYIAFMNGEGYYIEEDGLVQNGDIVHVSEDGNIYVIDRVN